MSITIRIDNREHGLHGFFAGCDNVVVEPLEVGDVIIEHASFKLIFERKTYADLFSSISDGRYREQKQRMLATAPPWNCSYILEGSPPEDDQIYTGAVVHTMFRDRMHVLWSRNTEDTSRIIKMIAGKCTANPAYFTTGDASQQNYIACVKAKTKKISNIDKDTCYLLQICQVPGISHKIASEIAKIYPNMQSLLECGSNKDERVAALCRIPMVGSKKARTIVEYLW
jgi:ERCC4-type nuclease